jgi:hypothetical protein
MSANSFYDLDYIIEISEHRFEYYASAYQKVLERLTHILLVYSAITIYLVPIIQDMIFEKNTIWLIVCFTIFSIFFFISVFFTVRLIMPAPMAYLREPKEYYLDYMRQYEQSMLDKTLITFLLKATYVDELERGIQINHQIFTRKSIFYRKALKYGLLAVIPYLVCIGIHVSKKDDKVQKVDIINAPKITKLQ